jgi:hypothetical protein
VERADLNRNLSVGVIVLITIGAIGGGSVGGATSRSSKIVQARVNCNAWGIARCADKLRGRIGGKPVNWASADCQFGYVGDLMRFVREAAHEQAAVEFN